MHVLRVRKLYSAREFATGYVEFYMECRGVSDVLGNGSDYGTLLLMKYWKWSGLAL